MVIVLPFLRNSSPAPCVCQSGSFTFYTLGLPHVKFRTDLRSGVYVLRKIKQARLVTVEGSGAINKCLCPLTIRMGQRNVWPQETQD